MNRVMNRIVTLALTLLGTYSLVFLIMDTVSCRVSRLYPLWLVLICVAVCCVGYSGKGVWIGLPALGVLAFLLYRYRAEELKNQFINFCDRITGVFAENILYRGRGYPYLDMASDYTILFLILGLLIAGYAAMALTSQGARVTLSLMGSVPFFVLCILVNENPPVPPVLGMLLYWFLTAAGGYIYREDSRIGFSPAAAAVPIVLLLAALLIFIDPDNYEYKAPRYVPDIDLKSMMQKADQAVNDYLSREDIQVPEYITAPVQTDGDRKQERQEETEDETPEQNREPVSLVWQGESGTLDLTQNAREEELKQVFLKIRASQGGAVYLRAVSFGDYTGTGWLPAGESPEVSSLALTAQAAKASGGSGQTLSVQVLAESAYRFLPYFSTEENGLDSCVLSENLDRYDADYCTFPQSPEDLMLPEQFAETEQLYREYAHTVYTRLPDSTRNALLSLCGEAGLSPDRTDLIPAVASYVQSQGVYDVNTEPYPSDDYAVYFLTEAHRGYCVHFATAATALYRALGVPARLTEGFLTESRAGTVSEVTGSDAHAWVEVYQDGLGWLPVEVTGQSGLDGGILGPVELPPEETSRQEEQEETQSQSPEPTAAPAAAATPQLPVGIVTQQPAPEPPEGRILRVLSRLLIAALLLAAPFLRRAVILGIRRRRFMQQDAGKGSVAVYHAARKASRFGEPVPEIVRITAERATFSRHIIQEEEREASCREYNGMIERIYSEMKPLQKLRFKYLDVFR